jgi:predicted nucleic acid-binding protein
MRSHDEIAFIDADVLIAAATGKEALSRAAMQVLDDPARKFASSVYVKMEVLPKALFYRRHDEAEFYETFFASVTHWAVHNDILQETAFLQARSFGLSALDAFHVAAALSVGASELITAERPTSPLFRVTRLRVLTIRPE